MWYAATRYRTSAGFIRCDGGNEQMSCDGVLSAFSDDNGTTVYWGSVKGAGDACRFVRVLKVLEVPASGPTGTTVERRKGWTVGAGGGPFA